MRFHRFWEGLEQSEIEGLLSTFNHLSFVLSSRVAWLLAKMWCILHVGLPAHWSKPWRHQARSGKLLLEEMDCWLDCWLDSWLDWLDWVISRSFPMFQIFFLSPLTKTAGIDRGYDHLLQRDLSDAAYLSEMLERFWSTKCELLIFAIALFCRTFMPCPCVYWLDTEKMCRQVWQSDWICLEALCLACTLRQHGRKALLWLYTAYFETRRKNWDVENIFLFAWHDLILVRDEITHASCCNHQVGVGAPNVLKLSASLKGYQDSRQLRTDCNYSTQNWQ